MQTQPKPGTETGSTLAEESAPEASPVPTESSVEAVLPNAS